MLFTFEIQWQGETTWTRSSKLFDELDSAAAAMADYLAISLQNEVQLAGRLVALRK